GGAGGGGGGGGGGRHGGRGVGAAAGRGGRRLPHRLDRAGVVLPPRRLPPVAPLPHGQAADPGPAVSVTGDAPSWRRPEPDPGSGRGMGEEEMRAAWVMEPPKLTGKIQVVHYDPAWPELFRREAERIRGALGETIGRD